MDRFLTRKQSAKEAEVEEVHVEENLETQTTKENNVRLFKFNEEKERWAPGCCQQRMEDVLFLPQRV